MEDSRIITCLCVWMAVCTLAAQGAKQPNILYIMSDDHAAHAIGAYGGRLAPLNPTPTLDQLAAEGVIMENTFCTNSVCSPSRASILTGQYSHINGVKSLGGKVPEENQTLPLAMRKAGYQTAVIGKWHLGIQPLAFDYYKVLRSQGKYHNPEFFERVNPSHKETKFTEQGYCSDLIAQSSIRWLKNRDKTQPFMLLTHFKAPHGPWDAHERYDSLYAHIDIPEPDSLWDNGNNGSIATRGHNDELLFNIGSSVGRRNKYRSHVGKARKLRATSPDMTDDELKRAGYQDYLKEYLRCVRGVDDNIKLLLDFIKAQGELDDTIIIYTSDQGMMLGEHDYIDKRWMYEESLRMPFIVRYPKAIKAGTRCDALVNNTDFAPTLLDYAGIPTPATMQGRSFRSIMEAGREPTDWRKATYYRYWMHMKHHYNPAHFGMRTKQWKLIFFCGADEKGEKGYARTPPGWELYNMKSDPLEMNNLHDNPQYREVIKQLKLQLKAVRAEVKDFDADYPHIQSIIDKHWHGDEQEAVQLSHHIVKNPVNAKKRGN